MDDGFLQELVAKAAQYMCLLSAKTTNDHHGEVAGGACETIYGILELIWDLSSSPSASQALESLGCIELVWGIAFQSDDDRVQELCFGALSNMCLQSSCCARLLAMPDAAAACVALCAPSAGLDVRSGSYLQVLRLSRVIFGEPAAAAQHAELLRPLADPEVCRQIAELFPDGHHPSDNELQVVIVDLIVYIVEHAVENVQFARIANNFIEVGVFRAALQALHGVSSDVPQIARLLSSCQNHAQSLNVYANCSVDCIIGACVTMLMHSSSSCGGVGTVILANSLRDGVVTAQRLLESPVAVEAISYEPVLSYCGEQGEGSGDADVAVWYITATLCIAADAQLCLSASRTDDIPAFVAALAMHLALSTWFLPAVCSVTSHSPNSQQYIESAAASAYRVMVAAANSALVTEPLDVRHPWSFGSDNLLQSVSSRGLTPKQLLLMALEKLRFNS